MQSQWITKSWFEISSCNIHVSIVSPLPHFLDTEIDMLLFGRIALLEPTGLYRYIHTNAVVVVLFLRSLARDELSTPQLALTQV
jgi:hypothetical protein